MNYSDIEQEDERYFSDQDEYAFEQSLQVFDTFIHLSIDHESVSYRQISCHDEKAVERLQRVKGDKRPFANRSYEPLASDKYCARPFFSRRFMKQTPLLGMPLIRLQSDPNPDMRNKEEDLVLVSSITPFSVSDLQINRLDTLQAVLPLSIRMVKPLEQIAQAYLKGKDLVIASALQLLMLVDLTKREPDRRSIQELIRYVYEHRRGGNLLGLANCLIDTINWLAWRPLNAQIEVNYFVKLPALRLSHNLLDISRDALVFKATTVKSGEGGRHFYIPLADVDQFLRNHQETRHEKREVLHAVFGQHNQTVLDIDIKREGPFEEPDIWNAIQSITYEQIQKAIEHLRQQLIPLCSRNTKRGDASVTFYKTGDKLSVRASLGLVINIDLQRQVLENLTAMAQATPLHEPTGPRACIPLVWEQFVYDILVRGLDPNPLMNGGSMRLPFQGKISNGQYIPTGRSFETPVPANLDSEVQAMKACLTVFCRRAQDILPESAKPVPIIMVKPQTSSRTIRRDLDEISIREAYIKTTRLQSGELDLIRHNENGYKFGTGNQRPYCPLCEKVHDGSNRYQHTGFIGRRGLYINCVSRLGQSDNRYLMCQFADQEGCIDTEEELSGDSDDEIDVTQQMLNALKRGVSANIKGPEEDKRNKDQVDLYYRDNYARIQTSEYLESLDPKDYRDISQKFISTISLKDLTERKTTLIRSPMGSGKTELVTKYLDEFQPASIVWLSSRKSYSTAMHSRLSEYAFALYDDEDHAGQMIYCDNEYILIQIDSLGRCEIAESIDLLVLDEVNSLLQQISDKPHIFVHLAHLIRKAHRVVVMDAQLEVSLCQTFMRMMNREAAQQDPSNRYHVPQVIWNRHKPFTNRTISIYDRDIRSDAMRTGCCLYILAMLSNGENVFVYVSTLEQQLALLQQLVFCKVPRDDILCINSETDQEERRKLFADIEQESAKYRVFLTTATLTIGVDINTPHFTRSVGVFSRQTASVQQFIQAVHRPRQIKSVVVFAEPDQQNRISYTTADMQAMVVPRGSMVLKTDILSAYTNVYCLALEQSPFSYLLGAFKDMGYKPVAMNLHAALEHAPLIKVPKRQRPPLILVADISRQQMLDQYLTYIHTILKHKIKDDENEVHWDLAVIQQELRVLFEVAHVLLEDLSQRPATWEAAGRNSGRIYDLHTYIKTIGVPLEWIVKANQAYWDGLLFRRVRSVVQSLPQQKRPFKETVLLVCQQLTENLSSRLIAMTNMQQRNLIDRDVLDERPIHDNIYHRAPKEQVTMERFRIKGVVLGKAGQARYKVVFRFDEGFICYIPDTQADLETREDVSEQQQELYKSLQIQLFCTRSD